MSGNERYDQDIHEWVWGAGGGSGVALQLLMTMEPDLAGNPTLIDSWDEPRHPLHPALRWKVE